MTKNEKSQSTTQQEPQNPDKRVESGNGLVIGGVLFLTIGLLLFAIIFHSVIAEEIAYRLFPPNRNSSVMTDRESKSAANKYAVIRPVDEDYGIVIPKIGANSRVIGNVSPYNEKEYQAELAKGVAQAHDTANPGEFGNVFIFAHSAGNLNLANQYNAVFYLLNKLEKKDPVYLFYKGKKYRYQVTAVKIVASNALEYLKQDNTKKELTLMTCWPPGTTFRRLIVQAQLQ